jgi:hypothetical protein
MPPTDTDEGLVAAQQIRTAQHLRLTDDPRSHRRVLAVLAYLRHHPHDIRLTGHEPQPAGQRA